jgi:hypothetical protein
MTCASTILVAYAAAIGLSAQICAPAAAQPTSLAPATQPGGNIGHSEAGSIIPPPLSITTRALLPGHWALHGSNYVWVPPETRLREVQAAALVQGRYVWRNGLYVWVPTHCRP